MKILIAYASKNGVAKKCAKMLANFLPSTAEVDVVDLTIKTPNLDGYDAVVVGGSVRGAKFNKKIRVFFKNNKAKLSIMPFAVYICCGFSHRYEEYKDILIPRGLYVSLGVHHFGGELKPDKLHGFDKLVVRSMRKSINEADFEDDDALDLSLPEIIPENILLLAEDLKRQNCIL